MALGARYPKGTLLHELAPDVDDPTADDIADRLNRLADLAAARQRLEGRHAALLACTRRHVIHLHGRIPAAELEEASGLTAEQLARLLAR